MIEIDIELSPEKMAEYCLATSAVVATVLTVVFWGSWLYVVGAWALMMPFAMLLGLIFGFVLRANGYVLEEVEEDESQMWTEDEDVVITERSPEIIGKFQDTLIHEWVILQRPDNGELIRLDYGYTIDMRGDFDFTPPDDVWFVILPPGIMYREPENSIAADPETD